MKETEERRVTVEDVLGEFGFRVRWSVTDYHAEVEAYELVSSVPEKVFAQKNWRSLPSDVTTDIDEGEIYLTGFVKWDGCTELSQGQPHWCGPDGYKKHIALIKYIYHRAFELMGREPEEPWGDE